MNTYSSSTRPGYGLETSRPPTRLLFWGAILAGSVAALAIHILLMMLGAGLGLAMYNPLTSDSPIANVGVGAVIIQGISSVIALWAGGWVAGRFSPHAGRFSGCLHGFMVWCFTTVVAIFMVSSSAGWAMGGMSKVVGGGLSMAGQPAAAAMGGAADLAENALGQSDDMLASFVEQGLSDAPDDQTPAEAIRAKRELGFALGRLAMAEPGAQEAQQQAVVDTLVERQGMSRAAAQEMVTEWSEAYAELKSDLAETADAVEQRAKEIAEETSDTLAILSLCSFAAFVIGAIAASLGGRHGCCWACKEDEIDDAKQTPRSGATT